VTRRGLEGFGERTHNRGRGEAGEEAGVAWLVARGYRVEARNVTNAGGELDLVAWDGDTLCFVEIKARSSDEYGHSLEAVTRDKQRRIARAAAMYLAERDRGEIACRFDVLGADRGVDGRWEMTLIQDAFEVGG
jgi:putative endonuclease